MRYSSIVILFALGALLSSGCTKTTPPATAFRIENRNQLIGGKRALGDVGDYKLSNGIVHAIIQNIGSSRGFGAFGGSLIDIDLVRGGAGNSATGVAGKDGFTEMFPAFFLQAFEPSKIEVIADGRDGGAAILRVSGQKGDFLSLLNSVNGLVIPQQSMDFSIDYILEPGKQYLKMIASITNSNPSQNAGFLITVPFGFVALLGEGQRLFVPGKAGYDMRFRLEDVYKQPSKLDALPGEVSSMVTTEGDGVSYAIAASPRNATYMATNPSFYPGAKPDSLLVPISASSFLGMYWAKPPTTMKPKQSFTYTGYVAVGSGDVASAQKIIYDIDDPGERHPTDYGTISGRVREAVTLIPLAGENVVLVDDKGNYAAQAKTLPDGTFSAPVPAGTYRAYAIDDVRSVGSSSRPVVVGNGGLVSTDVTMPQAGLLEATVRDDKGRALPAKISVEGIYDYAGTEPPRTFLYNLKLGERFRPSDLEPDTKDDPSTRRYLERVFFAPKGSAGKALRPGHYKVYASRGNEYSLVSQEVDIEAGKTSRLGFVLTHEMPTPGWASADFHVHSVNSVDSNMALDDRVASYAVEGVDYVTSTDHNFVTDFAPTVEALGLSEWLKSSVGLELTTLEMGHFNAFPILVQPGPVTHGSFAWFFRPPGELFAQLRGLGADSQRTVVQVNHPRDSILGYFNAFNLGTYTGTSLPSTKAISLDTKPLPDGRLSPYDPANFSLDFDALEVFNGKREQLRWSYRIPSQPIDGPAPSLPACFEGQRGGCIPAPGEILHDIVKVPVPGQPGVTHDQLQPSFPGALDDWYTLLAQGHKFTATGNSDSHSATAEAGLPRTYVHVGDTADGSMRAFSERAATDAVLHRDVVVTNGPMVQVSINGSGIGATVVAPDGHVTVKILVQAPSWMDVNRVVVLRGGKDQGERPQTLDTIAVAPSTDLTRLEVTKDYSGISDDSFIIVEAYGDKSMWPVFTPYEIPSLQITDAVSTLGSSFGLADKYGKYRPIQTTQVKPYGFTNPIFVTHTLKQGLSRAKRVMPVGSGEPFAPRTMTDLRRLFDAFHSDPE